jgi:hypothetical protein
MLARNSHFLVATLENLLYLLVLLRGALHFLSVLLVIPL